MQVSSLDAACRIVAAGLGLAILPRESTTVFASAAGLVMLPLAEPWAERRFVICSRAEAQLSATARLLAVHLQQGPRGRQEPAVPPVPAAALARGR